MLRKRSSPPSRETDQEVAQLQLRLSLSRVRPIEYLLEGYVEEWGLIIILVFSHFQYSSRYLEQESKAQLGTVVSRLSLSPHHK
jgi:hypothetical protein